MRLIPIECVKEGCYLAKTIFDENGRILLREGVRLTDNLVKRIRSINIFSLYITDEYSNGEIEDIIQPELRQKSIRVVRETFSSVERILTSLDTQNLSSKNKNLLIKQREEYFDDILNVATELIENILSNKQMLVNLVDIKSMDAYTYQHCVNVAVLSLVMGMSLNLPKNDLKDLCVGALIHDIGKVFVPKEIIVKNSSLTDDEFALMKTHPSKGYEYLSNAINLSSNSKLVILQHHEKEDGSGYPMALKGDQISLLAKIVAITDVYDALTSDRPYRKALSPCEALEFIMAGSGTHFDPDLVEAFTKVIVPFPTGTIVKLSNGEIAMVEETPPNYPLRPTIKILKSSIDNDRVGININLLTELSLVISSIQYEI